jgi:hypothetical protein
MKKMIHNLSNHVIYLLIYLFYSIILDLLKYFRLLYFFRFNLAFNKIILKIPYLI